MVSNVNFFIQPLAAQSLLSNETLLIIDLGTAESYQQHHIKGAVNLDYRHIIHGDLPAPGGLPTTSRLQALFDAIGLERDTHVLVYDDEGSGKASRFIWTLDVIGHQHYSVIDGGIIAWMNAGLPYSTEPVRPSPGQAKLNSSDNNFADKAYVLSVLNSDDHILLDVRSYPEYTGIRGGMRKGHIPGALHFEWLDAIDRSNDLKLFPELYLREKFDALGIDKNKEIITYCYTHHRSAHTYAVLKNLGYPRVKGYAGSWSEWNSDPNLPIE